MTELGIVDIREIIRTIKSVHDYDFSNYALTSLKQRLERLMNNSGITSADGLIKKISQDPAFMDVLLYETSVPSTEMFRDPSLWRWLREVYFPEVLDKNIGKFKIWLPNCVSGGELYSLAILMSEMGLTDKVQITATYFSDKMAEILKNGSYDTKKLEVSEENYKRANGAKELSAYYRTDKTGIIRNTSLIANVEFRKLNINFDNAPQNIKLILYRNQLIYYNPTQQEKVLQRLHGILSVSGHLVLGIRERISGISASREFEIINETESVYRKRMLN
jgi:chemotaxis protein methyltransferase CheR